MNWKLVVSAAQASNEMIFEGANGPVLQHCDDGCGVGPFGSPHAQQS